VAVFIQAAWSSASHTGASSSSADCSSWLLSTCCMPHPSPSALASSLTPKSSSPASIHARSGAAVASKKLRAGGGASETRGRFQQKYFPCLFLKIPVVT
jgi:hypothetical protein